MMIKECNKLIQQKHIRTKQKNLICKKEKDKCDNIIKQYKK